VEDNGRSSHPHDSGAARLSHRALFALFALSVVTVVAYAQLRPVYNWDMVAYVAIAGALGERDIERVHAETYALIERTLPDVAFDELIGRDDTSSSSVGFLRGTATDPHAFGQQLPFYLVKPAYPLLIALGSLVGLNPVVASVLISSISYVAFAVLVARWARRHHPASIAYALATLLVISPPFTILARLSTPDAMSLALLVASGYALTERRSGSMALLLSVLAVVVRPNNAAWVVLLAAYLALMAPAAIRPPRWVAGAAALGAVAIYGVLTVRFGYYPFPTLFYHSTIDYLARPADFTSPLGATDYLKQYVHQLLDFQYGAALLFGFLAGVVAVARRFAGGPRRDPMLGLVLVAIAAAAAQWIVYPIEPERILAGQLALIAIALICSVGRAGRRAAPLTDPGRGSYALSA
jgi:DIE2/ALG10 family